MTFRRKLAVSTIAASVALTAFAGIPLSNKGLAEKLGVSGVAYAATGSNADFLTEASKLYAALTPAGITAVNAFRLEIEAALSAPGNTILDAITVRLPEEKREGFKTVIKDLLSVPVSSNWKTDLEAKRILHKDYLKGLSEAAGVTLTVDDIAQVVLALETKMAAVAATVISISDINASLTNAIRDAAKAAIATNPNVKTVVDYYGVTSADFAAVYDKLQASDEVNIMTGFNAFVALYDAYKIVHPSPAGGGGGGFPPAIVEVPKEAKDLVAKLDGLKASIAAATGDAKAKLIADAVKEAQALVDILAKIENTITITDGKATLKLDEIKTLSAIAGIVAIADSLKAATGGAELSTLKLTIDLGAVTQDNVVIDLSTAIIEQAVKAKIAAISLKVGDLKVDLPVGGTFSSAISFTIKKSDASEEVTGGLQTASKVYDFNLTIGGVATTSFDQPIVISIPLGDTSKLDKELLSVAKIVDGKLEFHGGRISGSSIIESRDTFSSYVVVENKVSFDDIASVEAWAGREISVVAAKGAIQGKSAGVFAPKANVTRAEFAKMLVRALDLENGSATEGFADVKPGDWFAPYVAAAVKLEIINGRSATKFDPNATITRAEMATMIARALKNTQGATDVADIDAALKGFSDANKINASLKAGVAFAASNEIVKGNAGKFLPNNNATRAEAAVIIYRSLNFGK